MEDIPLTRRGPENGGNFEYPWAGGCLASHYISDVGRKREHNEDSAMVDPGSRFFVVADGMGGHAAGEVASV